MYVLAPDYDNDGVYDVMTIGYNSDNKHNFAPYEKVDVDETIINRDDYEQHVSTETAKYGDNWVYNFAKLKNVETLFPKETYDGYEPKDDLFEVWKLVKKSDKNSKFSQLFYEVRHKEYDKTWSDYSEYFWRDVGDQVFATLVASSISFAIMVSSIGLATPLAHVAYFVAYSTISKFQMDMKAKEAEALQRSSTLYPEGADRSEPTSLNQKYHTDEFWGDSMPAALSGHPGAYYATVMGGEVGAQYTAQAIVSPPNDARFWNQGNVPGMLDYLGHNVATFGSGNPDKFTALDFDNHNLDFLLVSSELYAYNDEPHYTYLEDPALIEALFVAEPEYALDQIKSRDSYLFRQNTLGYLTKKIRQASDGNLTTIRATCIDGHPQYIFTTGEDVVPKSALFQPLIVSPERYEELESRGLVDGYIVVDVQASSLASTQSIDTRGIDSNKLTTEEKSLYSAKIPLADIFGGFGYPIKSIEVFGISDDLVIDSHLLTTSEYNVSLGNLYFTKSLEELIPIFADFKLYYKMFGGDTLPQECYYKFVIHIAKIVPDDGSEETARNALNIATTYAVMDYFDQYTFAQTSAQMIAEIGYTEIMTITSTAISAPVVALGSYAVKAAQEATAAATNAVVGATSGAAQQVGQQATKFALKSLIFEIGKRVVIGTIKETIEEIVVDGFFETAIQSAVRMSGGSDAAGHWISTLFTSVRETANFGYLTGSRGSNAQGFAGQVQRATNLDSTLETYISTGMALKGETSLSRFATDYEQFITAKMDEIKILDKTLMESKISLGRILATGIFTGLSLLAPSLAGFNLYAIGKLVGGIGTKIDVKIQNKFLTARNSKMLSRHSEEIEKPKVELGKKPIDTQSDDNLPNVEAQVSLMTNVLNPLMARNPVESNIFGAMGATSAGIVMMGREGKLGPSATRDKYATLKKEQEIAKSQRVKAHLAKVAELDKGYDIEGEFAGIIAKLSESGKFKKSQFNRIQAALEKLKGEYYDEFTILDSSTEGLYGAINLHVMEVIEEKVKNQEELSQIENDIFNAKVVLLNAKKSFKGKYPPLHLLEEWDGKTSKYYPHFKFFVDNLDKILKHYKIAETATDRNWIISFGRDSLGEKLNALRGENEKGEPVTAQFSIDEKSFDRWYVRIESEIMQDTGIDRFEAMGFIDELFDTTLKKFGHKAYHPLYRSARLMLARMGEILVDGKAIDLNNYAHIDELLDKKGTCIQLFKNLKANPNSNPTTDPSENLRDKVIAAAKLASTKFTKAHTTQIRNIVQDYIDAVLNFRVGRDVLKDSRPSYRKLLLTQIIDKCDLLQKVGTLIGVSKLLFGGTENYITSHFLRTTENKDKRKPHLETIFRILYNINKWTVKTFSDLGITTTYDELNGFKRVIYDEVKGWVYNAEGKENNWVRYISKTKKPYKRGAVGTTELDFDLVFTVWQAAVMHEDNPDLGFTDMANLKLFERQAQWDVNLRKGQGFAPQTIRNVLNTVKQWQKKESKLNPSSYKLKYYFALQAQVGFYALKNRMNLAKPHGSTRKFNGREFTYDYIMAYHIVEGFGKHLGMDALFFSTIKDEAYHLTKDRRITLKRLGEKIITFIRHHFRDDPVGRNSFLSSDIVITDGSKHISWETLTEAESLVVLNGFEQLVRMKGSGSRMKGTSGINEITTADIERVFKGNEWVYARWYSDMKFVKNLEEFNNKRADIRTLRLDKFMQKYSPIAHARFYENIIKDKRRQLQYFLSELHPALDLSGVISAASGSPYQEQIIRAFSELLRQYNYPIRI